jgi:serine/threonine protein kinase
MKEAYPRKVKIGSRIGSDLSVLGLVDDAHRNSVYIVWHHRAWCPMACKFFHSRESARHEAEVLSALSHPGTVRLLGLGDPPHILMEFLAGPTLSRLIDDQPRKRLGISNAVRVAIHLGAALQHVHERGYMHLDVKPSNVIVAGGRPILCDFHLARRQGNIRPKRIHGTDPYIAPEECARQIVNPAADIFGLGVTLYEMLTGKLPFPRGTRRDPFPQTRQLPAPLRRHRPSAPKALEELVLRCLARDASARPAIPDLLPALHGFIRSGPSMWPADFHPNASRDCKFRNR